MWIEELRALISRYRSAFSVTWARRAEMAVARRSRDELAFQPAVIELSDSPVSPAPHAVMRIIMLLFLALILWASFGHLDIVAVASGKVVVDSRTKKVQALESAIVRNIAVADGDVVKRGQVLVELDAVGVVPDMRRALDGLAAAELNAARASAAVVAIDSDRVPVVPDIRGVSPVDMKHARELSISEFTAFKQKTDGLRASLSQRRAERQTTEDSIASLDEYAKISSDRVLDYRRLLERNYVSRQEYLTREQERINAQRDLQVQRNRVLELDVAIEVAKKELEATVADARKVALDAERQAHEQAAQIESELARARDRSKSMLLVSPVSGTVQELAIHTVGGVVSPAQPIMSIVPTAGDVEVEATVLNRDIGFVVPGQEVTVKVESFPYTEYGYVKGVVASVSRDAVPDEKAGLVFPVRVKLTKPWLDVDGRRLPVTPGMSLSVEVKTGTRTVMQYFLEPLQVHLGEGLRER